MITRSLSRWHSRSSGWLGSSILTIKAPAISNASRTRGLSSADGIHIQARRLAKKSKRRKSFLFGHLYFNITNIFCANKRVGHACICPRMVTA